MNTVEYPLERGTLQIATRIKQTMIRENLKIPFKKSMHWSFTCLLNMGNFDNRDSNVTLFFQSL